MKTNGLSEGFITNKMVNLSESFHAYNCFYGLVRLHQGWWYRASNDARNGEQSIEWRMNYCSIKTDGRFKWEEKIFSNICTNLIASRFHE